MISNYDKFLFDPLSFKAPFPWVGHLPFAYWLMNELRPKVFVELGTHFGNSYFAFCQASRESSINAKCFAVDTWEGEAHAGYYDKEVYNYVANHNEKNYSKFSTLLKMNFDEAVNRFEDSSIDLLHIDGLHTYEAVRHDFETWLPKVKPNGVVLFHDTVVKKNDFGVWRFWSELTKKYNFTLEFTHSNGLGVLQPSNVNHPHWLPINDNEKKVFVKTFGKLGEFFENRGRLNESDREINHYIIDIEAYQAKLKAKDKEIQAHVEDIEAYQAKLKAKDKEIQAHVEDIEAYQVKLKAKDKEIQAYVEDIKAYQAKLQAKDREMQLHIDNTYVYRDGFTKLKSVKIKLEKLLDYARRRINIFK